ncbi:uncharacterized protein LOC100568984 [Acyrthosiphon pisum]|uniref:Endonuclease/exonuclease/phosphatase domain-containing protein n=1 Tax=Acyrthosiphon pisum TaxID=7029 RepID=A0A8R2JN18_ACYPI|nr:uncharacterized protein LOC100568984 [Acyrthosiphon pisum]XP_008182071.2 uncharacterized protein LOC100568984 [Acyrthosiphon pisum]XP_029342528.1 uncharacterized protein LOC100568984 [Acyrthosiphon pisum]XP_029342529.1 uncharacterized protein LOC100568984 [Acyrthosiphon pisum]XP_029342530.1 uncharacterized protein LOC100568984 [Acyrthosiphon pisum]XP_029342531.1 uncharacterized protein LOC100568984 [Acyrthosiphon pisum]|eukprot:XP_003243857.3 PREDICTED: uncharacterized protein LOC100568984 [Acyrthosiphon pisum]
MLLNFTELHSMPNTPRIYLIGDFNETNQKWRDNELSDFNRWDSVDTQELTDSMILMIDVQSIQNVPHNIPQPVGENSQITEFINENENFEYLITPTTVQFYNHSDSTMNINNDRDSEQQVKHKSINSIQTTIYRSELPVVNEQASLPNVFNQTTGASKISKTTSTTSSLLKLLQPVRKK